MSRNPRWGRCSSRANALRAHSAAEADHREDPEVPAPRAGEIDWGDMFDWTPRISRRAKRGTQKPRSRLSYTPPPWRGGE